MTARALSLHGALAACLLAWPAPARAGEPDAETAGTLVAAGQSDAAHGRVRAAAVSCRRALRLANEAGDEALARAAFACVEDAERRVVHLVVRGAPPDTTLSLYGGPPEPVVERLALDPGTVVVTVIVPDGPREPVVLELRDGEEHVLDVASLARVPDEPRPPRPPGAWSARSMSLPSGMMSLGAWGFVSLLVGAKPKSTSPYQHEPTPIVFAPGWAASVRGAVSDDIELAATETFYRGLYPGDPLVELDARLLSGDFELGLDVTARIPGLDPGAGGGYLALRGSGRADGVLRVDGSVGLGAVQQLERHFGGVGLIQPLGVSMGGALPVAPGVALALTLTPVDTFYFGLDSGFGMQSFVEPGSMFVPFGLRLGGTVPVGDAALVDLEFRWTFPYALMPVRGEEPFLPPHAKREAVFDSFSVAFGAQAYFYP
ncbi:MAG: hypothetical protein IT373_38475 [Polyangiaceae bacterium]|nr:hypothetical protein [Polyangiaceae bacterium]